jgi:hypothetical protein
LELTFVGRLVLWLAVGLLAIGVFLSNTLILLLTTFLFTYFLFEGLSFHRAVKVATDSIKLENYPSTIETTIGQAFKVETTLTKSSHSKLRITRFSHNLPSQLEEVHPPIFRAESHEKQQIETLLTTSTPGKSEITESTIVLQGRAHLFCQRVELADKINIIAWPLVKRTVAPIEAGALVDLTVDHLRLGTGTDLAGLRPFRLLDDSHSIDWKATARTGKLMTRESYLEKDPTIMLMIDSSTSTNTRGHERSVLQAFLSEAGNLLGSIRPASPLRLIMYDENRVIVNIEPVQGVNRSERILHTLLEEMKATRPPAPLERQAIGRCADLARETKGLVSELALTARAKAYWDRFSSFASFILPFYERAEAKYFKRLRRQGAFKAFEIVCTLPEPILVIAISDGGTNFDGLAEGAKNARILNHQIILAILKGHGPTNPIEGISLLEDQGICVLRCTPEVLSRTIHDQILNMTRSRSITASAVRQSVTR